MGVGPNMASNKLISWRMDFLEMEEEDEVWRIRGVRGQVGLNGLNVEQRIKVLDRDVALVDARVYRSMRPVSASIVWLVSLGPLIDEEFTVTMR